MATQTLNFRLGNTWTPVVTVTAPFSLDGFTATAGLYDKPSRTDGTQAVPIVATVVADAEVDGGTVNLVLSSTAQEAAIAGSALTHGSYFLSVQIYRSSDSYVHEIDPQLVVISGDTIA